MAVSPTMSRPTSLLRRAATTATALLCALLLAGCIDQQPAPVPTPPPSAAAAAGRYYVDCSSPSNGDGSRTSPWNATASIAAHGPFAPGERILLRRGTACAGRVLPTGSGVNGAPIVLGAYGSGPAPVVAAGGTPDQTGAVQLTDVHDWVIQDLEVTNRDAAGPDDTLRAGILVVDDGSGTLGRIRVRRNTVRSVTSSPAGATTDPHKFGGISVLVRGGGARAGALADVRIEDNLVDDVGRIGIVAWSDAWPASPLTAVSITDNHVVDPDGDGIIVWGVDGGVMEHNRSEGGGRLPACPRCSVGVANTASAGIWPVMSRNVLIRYNEALGVGAAGGDGEGFDIDDSTSAVLLEGNYSHDNDGGAVLVCGARDTIVRSNVFADNGGGAVTFSCPTQRDAVRIVNNTFFLPAGGSTQMVRHGRTSGKDPVLFANNLVVDLDGGGYDWPVPVEAKGNLYAGIVPRSAPADADAPIDPGLVAAGTGGSGLDSVSGYRPLTGSAAAAGGVPLPDVGTLDYFGMTRTGAPGRGAIGASVAATDLSAVSPVAARAGADVVLTWTATSGTAWQVQRSVDGSPFHGITGVLTNQRFVDAAAPGGALRYRLVQVGRDAEGTPSAPVSVG